MNKQAQRLAVIASLAVRWLGFGLTGLLSLVHWMRAGNWEFSGSWQYGLVLLDPRVPAALCWWVLHATFLIGVIIPVSQWLADRVPVGGPLRLFAIATLAVGLGTRGIVGPLVMRAAAAAPAVLQTVGGAPVTSWLLNVAAARWFVVFTECWWLLPFLVLAIHATAPLRSGRPANRVRLGALIGLYCLIQPADVPYLLTAGGPQGATTNLQLIAIQEGWGRQEFGYASALTVLLCLAALLSIWLIPVRPRYENTDLTTTKPAVNPVLWVIAGTLVLLPIVLATSRGFPWKHEWPSGGALLAAVGSTALSAAITSYLANALSRELPTPHAPILHRLAHAALFFPGLVLILPLIRPLGVRNGAAALTVLVISLAFLSPYLALTSYTAALIRQLGIRERNRRRILIFVAAWATWTDLTLPLLLPHNQHPFLPLQGWMLWDLSAHLRASPLSVPGWTVTWLGGTLLGALAGFYLLGLRDGADSGFGGAKLASAAPGPGTGPQRCTSPHDPA